MHDRCMWGKTVGHLLYVLLVIPAASRLLERFQVLHCNVLKVKKKKITKAILSCIFSVGNEYIELKKPCF